MVNKIEDKHNYLVKYSLIKEEKGYIIAYSSDSHGDDEFSEYETSDTFADQMIRKLWTKTQNREYKIDKVLKELEELKVKD